MHYDYSILIALAYSNPTRALATRYNTFMFAIVLVIPVRASSPIFINCIAMFSIFAIKHSFFTTKCTIVYAHFITRFSDKVYLLI